MTYTTPLGVVPPLFGRGEWPLVHNRFVSRHGGDAVGQEQPTRVVPQQVAPRESRIGVVINSDRAGGRRDEDTTDQLVINVFLDAFRAKTTADNRAIRAGDGGQGSGLVPGIFGDSPQWVGGGDHLPALVVLIRGEATTRIGAGDESATPVVAVLRDATSRVSRCHQLASKVVTEMTLSIH